MTYELKEMIEVAEMYYKENLKQESIARRLGVSKYSVRRMLQKARDLSMVTIEIGKTGNFRE